MKSQSAILFFKRQVSLTSALQPLKLPNILKYSFIDCFLESLVGHFVLTLKISIRYPHLWASAEIGKILTGLSSQMNPEQYYVFLWASSQHWIKAGNNKFERE